MAKSRLNLSALKNILFLPNDPFQPLTRFDLIRLKNWMLASIFLSNIVARILMNNFLFRGGPLPSTELMLFVGPFGDTFRFVFFLLGIVIFVFIYERPIRRTLNDIFHSRTTSHGTIETARRRLLNEPFYMMALNLSIWILAAFFFAYCFRVKFEKSYLEC